MFSITEKSFGPYTEYRLVNIETGAYVSVLPELGATLNQVALRKSGRLYELLDGSPTYEVFLKEGKPKFKGSKLFPFPNRIADGQYEFEGNTYRFPVNFPQEQNAIHGILLDCVFTVEEKRTDDSFALLGLYYETTGTEQGYPFKTGIKICYTLDQEGFSCKTTLVNLDQQNVPVGDGWHPYFQTGTVLDECILTLPVAHAYAVDHRMIPTGTTFPENHFVKGATIGDHLFDTGYQLLKTDQSCLATVLYDPIKDLTVSIWQEAGEGKYNYVQIYIPPDRRSIAVEPMTCLADSFNNQTGKLILAPQERCDFSFGFKLE